ncbi:hypothetical protein BDQ17DRAFT_1329967 [Cyathus striatus]|nr:hypothetical protein BDQ17DRAFT_1329967 [Cyathus striatus]
MAFFWPGITRSFPLYLYPPCNWQPVPVAVTPAAQFPYLPNYLPPPSYTPGWNPFRTILFSHPNALSPFPPRSPWLLLNVAIWVRLVVPSGNNYTKMPCDENNRNLKTRTVEDENVENKSVEGENVKIKSVENKNVKIRSVEREYAGSSYD